MKISKMYDITWKVKNNMLSRLLYKINKFYVNIIYPKTVRLNWGLDDCSDIIVSLTSFPERINTVWITIATILNQSVKPKKIILWLASEQFPNGESELPCNLLKLKKYGLTIRFCDNLYPHKKYYYTMLENPSSTIITVDDDVFYPEYLIEKLIELSFENPNTICCTWAHRIELDEMNRILPYKQWQHGVIDNFSPEMLLMPVGIGGVLYPPHCIDNRAFDIEKISKLALMTDDLWLKAMEILNGIKSVRINYEYKQIFFTILRTQSSGLYSNNIGESRNDESLRMIVDMYPQIRKILMGGRDDSK